MQLSIHYYVLLLSEQMSRLYEGFRDKLIDIQNTHFPFETTIDVGNPASKDIQLKKFYHQQTSTLPIIINKIHLH